MSKLAEGAICIESSRMLSSGARIPLILDAAIKIRSSVRGLGGIGLYPGVIVALKGRNGGGGYFLATEILAVSTWFPPYLISAIFTYNFTDPPSQTIPRSERDHKSKARSPWFLKSRHYACCLRTLHCGY